MCVMCMPEVNCDVDVRIAPITSSNAHQTCALHHFVLYFFPYTQHENHTDDDVERNDNLLLQIRMAGLADLRGNQRIGNGVDLGLKRRMVLVTSCTLDKCTEHGLQ